MAQRFPGPAPPQVPGGPPPQRYPPQQSPGMRPYGAQNFPVSSILLLMGVENPEGSYMFVHYRLCNP